MQTDEHGIPLSRYAHEWKAMVLHAHKIEAQERAMRTMQVVTQTCEPLCIDEHGMMHFLGTATVVPARKWKRRAISITFHGGERRLNVKCDCGRPERITIDTWKTTIGEACAACSKRRRRDPMPTTQEAFVRALDNAHAKREQRVVLPFARNPEASR